MATTAMMGTNSDQKANPKVHRKGNLLEAGGHVVFDSRSKALSTVEPGGHEIPPPPKPVKISNLAIQQSN